MILTKRKQKLASFLRKLGYDARVRKDYVLVNGNVNPDDLAEVDIPTADLEVIRKATSTTIIPREIQGSWLPGKETGIVGAFSIPAQLPRT